MKRRIAFLALLLAVCLTVAATAEMSYPAYGACRGERVNVRRQPESKTPSSGRLIRNAPIIIMGESKDGSCWYCSTFYGDGYVPKMYVEVFEDMDYEEFREYCDIHPNVYRQMYQLSNVELLDRYLSGQITESELKQYWHRQPVTGYLGWHFDKDGDIVLTNENLIKKWIKYCKTHRKK